MERHDLLVLFGRGLFDGRRRVRGRVGGLSRVRRIDFGGFRGTPSLAVHLAFLLESRLSGHHEERRVFPVEWSKEAKKVVFRGEESFVLMRKSQSES